MHERNKIAFGVLSIRKVYMTQPLETSLADGLPMVTCINQRQTTRVLVPKRQLFL